MRAAWWWVLVGCAGDAPSGGFAWPDRSDVAIETWPRPEACASEAPVLGEAGATTGRTEPVTWRWDPGLRLSIGEPFYGVLPDDTTSFAVTPFHDGTPTALGWLVVDGRVWVDALLPPDDLPQTPMTPVDAVPGLDTWDTWWATGGDSVIAVESAIDTSWDTAAQAGAPSRLGWWTAPFFHGPGVASSVTLPISPSTAPGTGCLAVLPVAAANLDGQTGTLHVQVRRGPAAALDRLNLRVQVVDGAGIAPEAVEAATRRAFTLLAAGGSLAAGEVVAEVITGPDDALVAFNSPEIDALYAAEGAQPDEVVVVLVRDFLGGSGTLGMAGGIPGPLGLVGTPRSAVLLSVDAHRRYDGTLNEVALGETLAHEVGHQLGLFHTTEADGLSFDPLADTPSCDAATWDLDGDGYVGAGECRFADGQNFMFWTAGGAGLAQDGLSADQAWVLTRSVLAGGG